MTSETENPKASPETGQEGQPQTEPKGQPDAEPKAGAAEPGTTDAAQEIARLRQDYENLQRKLTEQGEELGNHRRFRQQYDEWQARQQAQADPIASASDEMAQALGSFDPEKIAAAQRRYAEAVRESARQAARADAAEFSRGLLKAFEGRDAGKDWGVTEGQLAETVKRLREGSSDMTALARLAALEHGTYDKAIQQRKEREARESRLAALAGSQADGRATGPGRLGKGAGKARFQELRVIQHLRHDLRPADERAEKFIKEYMSGVDPESVPQEMKHLIG